MSVSNEYSRLFAKSKQVPCASCAKGAVTFGTAHMTIGKNLSFHPGLKVREIV
jgi:hypothetical protein